MDSPLHRVHQKDRLVAAHVWPNGVCAKLLEILLREEPHDLLISEFVLAETKRVLADRFGVPEIVIAEFEAKLRTGSTGVSFHPVRPPLRVAVRDPDDAWVLTAALAAGADVLVTGDKDLLALAGQVEALTVAAPRALLNALRTEESGA